MTRVSPWLLENSYFKGTTGEDIFFYYSLVTVSAQLSLNVFIEYHSALKSSSLS